MIATIVVLIALFLIYVGGGNGEWGVVAIAVIAALVLLIGLSGARKSSRAYWNCVDYWCRGGPEHGQRQYRRRRW